MHEVIERLTGLLREHYVFPEVAEKIIEVLQAGDYPSSPSLLAPRLTEDLQSVNGDKHLRVVHGAAAEAQHHEDLVAWSARTGGGVGRVERLDGNIALIEITPLLFPSSIAGDAVAAAMTLAAGSDALILDVRRCRGGAPDMVTFLCSYLFSEEPLHLNGIYFRDGDYTKQYWTLPHLPSPRYGPDRPVAVLTSANTFSGGEELAWDLQEHRRATIIGEVTRGGAHPREAYSIHPQLQVTIPIARSVSPLSGANWEGTGVRPDIEVPADQALEFARQGYKQWSIMAS